MSKPEVFLSDSDVPKQVSIATTLIPWRKDDNRARYLGYLACGFSPEESLYMMGKKLDWLEEQRQSSDFAAFELKVPEIRKELSREYIELDFFRNFRMVLEKDYRVLKKALEFSDVGIMSTQDHQYLLKMRSAYTPQQLQILAQVMSGVGEGGFNFAKWVEEHKEVIEFSRTDKITMRKEVTSGKKDNIS